MQTETSSRERRAARLEAILEYIDAHCGEALPIARLAGMAYVSPFHFHREFSAYLGESVSAYVRRRVLERAARQLQQPGASVAACGDAAGYANPASFARAFQRQFGSSPSRHQVHFDCLPETGRLLLPEGAPELRELPDLDVRAVRRCGPWRESTRMAWYALSAALQDAGDTSENLLCIGIPGGHPELDPQAPNHYCACILTGQTKPPGVRKRVAGGDYAVFRYEGRYSGLARAHAALLWRHAPERGLRLREGTAFHCFTNLARALDDDPEFIAEILLPIAADARRNRNPLRLRGSARTPGIARISASPG